MGFARSRVSPAAPRVRIAGLLAVLAFAVNAPAAGPFALERQPILMIGASLENGSPPFNDQLLAPFGGAAVNAGSYLSLGDALTVLGIFVVNEAQSGATSFDRDFCGPDTCAPFGWQGFGVQFQKALARVGGENASYLWIGLGNDCLTSIAVGAPWGAPPFGACSLSEVNVYIDRVITVAEQAKSAGLTPILPLYPSYDDLDLPLLQQQTGLPYVAGEQEYNFIASTWERRLSRELDDVIILDVWKRFEHLGDGLHPTPRTSLVAASTVALAIRRLERRRR